MLFIFHSVASIVSNNSNLFANIFLSSTDISFGIFEHFFHVSLIRRAVFKFLFVKLWCFEK